MPTIVFLGAGSVVFTRQLLTDLLRYPDLPVLDLALHDERRYGDTLIRIYGP